MALRKITYLMYPAAQQAERLLELLCLHQRVYNTALEERIAAYRETGKSLGFAAQCKALTTWRKAVAKLSVESRRIANCRKDFLYKTSADLVKRYGLIATEQLNVKNMTAAGGERKKGLNHSILDTAPAHSSTCSRPKRKKLGHCGWKSRPVW